MTEDVGDDDGRDPSREDEHRLCLDGKSVTKFQSERPGPCSECVPQSFGGDDVSGAGEASDTVRDVLVRPVNLC